MKSYHLMSNTYAPTLKEDPVEAELASHKLLLRAGMIRRASAGLYSYLPLAWRSMRKIEAVIRDEMEGIGAQEMLVPMVVPGEIWQESGRWDVYGPELLRMRDRHDRDLVMGPTHEETFVDLVKNELRSYKQLPVTLYQIQDKFRDEIRPRFGLMRGREFIMKDAYSFDADVEGMQKSYEEEKAAYARICERCGLEAVPVVADSGQIGGDTSVEFMALAEAGEASLVYCDCGFAADTEAATAKIEIEEGPGTTCEKIATPCEGSIAALADFMGVSEKACRKSFAIIAEDETPVLCILPGDHELCEVKGEHAFGHYDIMDEETLAKYGLVKGYMGPIGCSEAVKVVADVALKESKKWLIGANEEGYHIQAACPGVDFEVDEWIDLSEAKEGDGCPKCGAPLKAARGIEVSQVFQLGTKYSEAMGATFMDVDGKERPFQMGCYGIGVSRTLQAVVEQHHDEHGIVWPVCVAPYEVEIVPLTVNDDTVWPMAEKVAAELSAAGLEVLVDDRKERAGVKFADADLMGFPYQVVLGKRGVLAGEAEVKVRATGERLNMPFAELCAWLTGKIVPERS